MQKNLKNFTMNRGGSRAGAGRKSTGEKIITSFRLSKEPFLKAKELHKRGLNKLVDEFIKSLGS